jgi:hypothetical protein
MYHSKQKKATVGAKMKKALGGMSMKKMKIMKEGGKLKMVKGPDGKMVPFYAADGKGKMAMGGRMGSKEMMESIKKDDKMLQNGGGVNGKKRMIKKIKKALLKGGTESLMELNSSELNRLNKKLTPGRQAIGPKAKAEDVKKIREAFPKKKMGHGGGVMLIMPVKKSKKKAMMGAKMKGMKARYGAKMKK